LFSTDLVEVLASDAILLYEVMRVIDSVCLFLEDHYKRLFQSAQIIGISLKIPEEEFADSIYKLIGANGFVTGNIKVLLQSGNGRQSAFYYFVPHAYPDPVSYKEGVKTDLLKAERLNPQAKIFQANLREKTNSLIAEKKIYELILVDSKDRIMEGSKTNIFFVKGREFYTPKAELVLPGVTRRKIIECLSELGFLCMEADIPYKAIGEYDAAFLSGTSPKVLPVAQIGEQLFKADHPPLLLLMNAYDGKVDTYIRNFRGHAL
jgi:branched-chain amino acid aminotransferase